MEFETLGKKEMRTKRKKSMINKESKRRAINTAYKKSFKFLNRQFNKVMATPSSQSEKNDAYKKLICAVSKMKKKNIIKKNKAARLQSKIDLKLNTA